MADDGEPTFLVPRTVRVVPAAELQERRLAQLARAATELVEVIRDSVAEAIADAPDTHPVIQTDTDLNGTKFAMVFEVASYEYIISALLSAGFWPIGVSNYHEHLSISFVRNEDAHTSWMADLSS